MRKTIRKSQRGLTFSFQPLAELGIGAHYNYIIEKTSAPEIRIVPAQDGKYTISRKRNGEKWLSLIDLRNREVLNAVADMEKIGVRFTAGEIIVYDAAAEEGSKEKKSAVLLRYPRAALADLRMAAGMDDAAAVNALFSGAQISIDEYLSSLSAPAVSIPTIHKDLADVYTVVSLFSGAGILDWPFAQDERFSIQYAIDYDAAACQTYRHNIGMHVVHGDIHRAFSDDGYTQDSLITKSPDIVIGGPSCKPFSNANRHTRLEDHPDSDLVMQYMRIIRKLQPKTFAMENVPAVLTACDGAYYDAIKSVAEECGYEIGARIVQDNKVGGYTTRRRAIIIGSRVGPVQFNVLSIGTGSLAAGDALKNVTAEWSNYSDVTLPGPDTKRRMSFVPQGGNYTSIPEEYQTASKNRHSCTYRRLSLSEPAPTLVNWRKPPIIHPTEDRTLTVAEAKALQGLPGTFKILGTLGQMQQQVGNSVPVALGRYIKNVLLTMLKAAERDAGLCFA